MERYPIARFTDMPGKIDVHVIGSPVPTLPRTGEASPGPAAAALANAVADALGQRLRDMPLSAERVKAAMEG